MGKLTILKTGGLCTIQDLGRFGYRRYGIPESGVMDPVAMLEANRLVGNEPEFPVIEFALQGLKIEANETTVIGVAGANVSIQINEIRVESNLSHLVERGDIIQISSPHNGNYAYLAIGGILEATKEFGSYSTYLMAGFGGVQGKGIQKGMELHTKYQTQYEERVSIDKPSNLNQPIIGYMAGPEFDTDSSIPNRSQFVIDASSNRMGIRLNGTRWEGGGDIISSAVIPGTIQLPSNGQPIVLMRDCQTTGGYKRVGQVVEEDLSKLAQIPFGKEVTLVRIE